MNSSATYDIVIIGGGLAGLSLAILMGRLQYKVLVLEKENYPRHKVCGEYISMESKPFLEMLGMPVSDMNLPVINRLMLTDTKGNEVDTPLPQGGFGISRYKLDAALAALAEKAGVTLLTKTKVDNVVWANDRFSVHAGANEYTARVACGTWGKRSNVDVKWQRLFIKQKPNALNNYVAIKYHISYAWPTAYVGLHNFTNGYCGISQIEDGKCCMCYLTTAATLHSHRNDIKKMEQEVLMKNPWLNKIFSEAEFLYESPVAISQISFDKKEQVLDHVLLLGDAAGMITPLCGNGMSMAFNTAKIAGALINDFFRGSITRHTMEESYTATWQKNFAGRLTLGRLMQRNFGKDRTTAFFIKAMNVLPFVRKALINGTSGRPF
jgi:flavin-dependent dehydrogenase